jgi:flagellar motility protein MotE (MotC chaperone)
MKKIWDVLVLTLAVNFLAVVALVGWMYQSGHVDKDRLTKIKEVLFAQPATQPAPQPAADATTQPSMQLDELLNKSRNMTAGQQVDFIRQTFDSQMAQLDRRARELADLKAQIDLANAKLVDDRAILDDDRKKFTEQQERIRQAASDQGFQDSLNLYSAMPSKQVKTIFMALDDQAVLQYLRAMDSRTAGKVIKEFKTPEETVRIQHLLEMMRNGDPTTREVKE